MLRLTKSLLSGHSFLARKSFVTSPFLCRHMADDKKEDAKKEKPEQKDAKDAKDAKAKKAKPAKPPPDVNTDLEKLRKLQALFQENNGLPVFLKGGARDQLLYRGTLGLVILGLLLQVKLFLELILK